MKNFLIKLMIGGLFVGVLCFPAASEENNTTEFHGYYKTLPISSRSVYTDESYFAVINRLRLEFKKQINPWQFYLTMDNEAIVNDFANTPDFDSIRGRAQHEVAAVDLDKVSADSDHLYARHSLYRAYVRYYKPEFQAAVGKQTVDWGKLRFYSPLDVFSPVGELELEPDERPGVDAVNVNFIPAEFAGFNPVFAPGENEGESSGGLKIYKTIATYDLSMIAATIKKDEIYGLAFDGYLAQAGFRGEAAQVVQDNGRRFARVGLGLDYNFTKKFYGLVEQFYNGGHDDNDSTALTSSYRSARQIMSLKTNITSTWLKYSLTPLLDFNQYIIYDWDGQSIALNPELKYNVTQNIDIRVGSQFYWGNAASEFGDSENIHYAEFKFFF